MSKRWEASVSVSNTWHGWVPGRTGVANWKGVTWLWFIAVIQWEVA